MHLSLIFCCYFSSYRLSNAYWRLWTRPSLVHIRSCRLFSVWPLSEPVLVYYKMIAWNHISIKLQRKLTHFQSIKCNCKFHVANMELPWVLSASCGLHIGPMNLVIRVVGLFWLWHCSFCHIHIFKVSLLANIAKILTPQDMVEYKHYQAAKQIQQSAKNCVYIFYWANCMLLLIP